MAILAAWIPAGDAWGDPLWFQGGESGTSGITDGASSSYPLLQSSVVAQGDYAFHLANPTNATDWFVVDPTASPQAGTQLFFLSKLGGATADQVANVQVSTNGGASWTPLLAPQPGDGYPGEGSFSLKSADLSGYAGLDVSFRFSLDYSFGSRYTGDTPDFGWVVDSIQMADSFAKIPYSIGQPSDNEQLMLELINRARADALVEASRLANSTDPDITDSMSYFNITPQSVIDSFNDNVNTGFIDRHAQPLAFQETLNQTAELHSQDQFDNSFQGHYSSSNPPFPFEPGDGPTDRANALGYPGGVAENVYAYADSVEHGHAGFDIDWGVPSLGHRRSIHNDDYKEIGLGIIEGSNGSVGPMIITENFANPGEVAYVTGVVYEDLNGNNFYDIGEGRGGVQVDLEDSIYYAVTSESGGYAIPAPQNGTFSLNFSGEGFEDYSTTATITDLRNVKVDYLAAAGQGLDGDFNHDLYVDAADYAVWRNGYGDAYDMDDYYLWRQNYGLSAVEVATPRAAPEPSAMLLTASLAFVLFRRRVP